MLILEAEDIEVISFEHDKQGLTLFEGLEIAAMLSLECSWDAFREGKATRADLLAIQSEHDRELRANPSLVDCADFRAEIARLLTITPRASR